MDNLPQRKQLRLKDYDYSQAGYYFITICTYERQHLFGEIDAGQMILNEYGQIAQTEWVRSAEIRKEIKIDKFVIMPNHLHAIMVIDPVGPYGYTAGNNGHTTESNTSENNTQKDLRTYCHTSLQSPSKNVGAMIRGFKSSVTTKINILRNTPLPVWQAKYYDHIIRNRQEYHKIFNYIVNNPAKWQEDKYYI